MKRTKILCVLLSLIMVLMALLPAAANTGDTDEFFSGDLDDFTGACLKAYVLNAMLGFDGFASISETDDLWIFLGGIPGEFQWDPIYITINKQTGESGTLEPINAEDFEILTAAVPLEIPEEFIGKESTFSLESSAETTETEVESPTENESAVESAVCPSPLSCADTEAGTCADRCGSNNACLERCLRSGNVFPEHQYNPIAPVVEDELPKMSDAFLADMVLLAEKGMLGTEAYNTTYVTMNKISINAKQVNSWYFNLLGEDIKNGIVHFNLRWESDPENQKLGDSNCGMFGRYDNSGYINFWIDQTGSAGIYNRSANSGEELDENSFGPEATSGSMPVTILLLDNNAVILCDGEVCASSNSIQRATPGYFLFYATTGTDSGIGTRCEYADIEILSFE